MSERRPSRRTQDRLRWTHELVRLVVEAAELETTLDITPLAQQRAIAEVEARILTTLSAIREGQAWPTEGGAHD